MLAEITREELVDVLEGVITDLLAEGRVERPPVDAVGLAESLGITVALDDRQRGRARFVRLGGRRRPRETILLRPDPRPERRQWAVAHEIGESAAYRVFDALGVDPREASAGAREAVANRLASLLLLPGRWFSADASDHGWDLFALKRRYTTASHELIARRMLEMPPPVIISIFDNGRAWFRRSNVPGRVPPLSPAETECRQIAHDQNQPHTAPDALQLIQAWPVHEDAWKREIIRTEVEEGFG